jgi:hypothetical protein
MTDFVNDTFSGTAGQTLQAYSASWSVTGGTNLVISDNGRLRASATSVTAQYEHSGTPASADYHVSADFVYVGAQTSQPGILLRRTASTTYYFVRYETDLQLFRLYKLISGTATQLGSDFSSSLSVGNTMRVTLEAIGTAIKVYRDGTEIMSETDSAISGAGKAGIRFSHGSGTPSNSLGLHLDNYVATDGVFDPVVPVDFSGTVPTQNLTEDVAMTPLDLSTYFTGTETPFVYTLQAGTLPAGLSLDDETGVISGTPTTIENQTGIVIRATDDAADTADTNAFTIDVAAPAPDPNTITVTDPIKNNTGTVLADETGISVSVLDAATLESVYEADDLTTDEDGLLSTITDAAIIAEEDYHVVIKLADGSIGVTGVITAS